MQVSESVKVADESMLDEHATSAPRAPARFGATLTARSLDLGKQQVLDVIPATWGQILYLELNCTLTEIFAPVGSHPQRQMR
jgi:hypothetical protein